MVTSMILGLLLAWFQQAAPASSPVLNVIPQPSSVQMGAGSTAVPSPVRIGYEDAGSRRTAELLAESLELFYGLEATTVQGGSGAHIRLKAPASADTLGSEGYRLVADASGVDIHGTEAGLFYGAQTLVQLVEAAEGAARLPNLAITDVPRFRWRGMHLDVSRHFRSVEFVKKYVDLMSRYKMNTFHWHLTDDQGWRVEIKAYPKLTEVGGWRKETMVARNFDPYVGDGIRHGGFYTQDEIREVVAYAAERHITVVPEIEMPGHALAALAAYPELACTPGPFEVTGVWGVFEDIFCPTETTFAFLENVLAEVLEMFPSKYIHIGGDEVPKKRWEESAEAQAVMRREGLADEHELQSWFVQRIERFLNGHGRILIGWDEILEGGLAPNAVVMSWRGEEGGVEAASQGHDVVMSPNPVLYFDHYQADPATEPLAFGGFSPPEKVYNYEPIPAQLDRRFAHHVLGAQGNMWAEYMKTSDQVEYMAFPRLMALAERVWSPATVRDFGDFGRRTFRQYALLDQLDVNYRIPDPLGWGDIVTLADEATVELQTPVPGGCLQYTLDGSDPDEGADCEPDISQRIPLMEGSIATMRVVVVTAEGRRSNVRSMLVQQLVMVPGRTTDVNTLMPGLERKVFEGDFRSAKPLAETDPTRRDAAGTVAQLTDGPERYGLVYDGYLQIPFDGIYTVSLTSDDGSVFYHEGILEIDNDGLHVSRTRTAKLALGSGLHKFRVAYIQRGGGSGLNLDIRNARGEPVRVLYWRDQD